MKESPGERVTILWIFENRAGVSALPRKLAQRLFFVYDEKGQLRFSWVEKTGIQERVVSEIEGGTHTIFKICRQLDQTKTKTCRFSDTKPLISKGW